MSVHGGGGAWSRGVPVPGGAWSGGSGPGGGLVLGGVPGPRCGWYVSYWNAFLLMFFFQLKTLSIVVNNTQFICIPLKIINNICLKFCDFSSILCDFPSLFQSV